MTCETEQSLLDHAMFRLSLTTSLDESEPEILIAFFWLYSKQGRKPKVACFMTDELMDGLIY